MFFSRISISPNISCITQGLQEHFQVLTSICMSLLGFTSQTLGLGRYMTSPRQLQRLIMSTIVVSDDKGSLLLLYRKGEGGQHKTCIRPTQVTIYLSQKSIPHGMLYNTMMPSVTLSFYPTPRWCALQAWCPFGLVTTKTITQGEKVPTTKVQAHVELKKASHSHHSSYSSHFMLALL